MSTEQIAIIAAMLVPFLISAFFTYINPDEKMDGFLALCLVPVLNLIVMLAIIAEQINTKNHYITRFNTVMECKECGIYTRKGYLLDNNGHYHNSSCPHCDCKYFKDADIDWKNDISRSKKLSWKNIKEMLDGKSKYTLELIEKEQEKRMRELNKKKEL